MSAIVTSNMRIYAAQQFISGFSNTSQNMYLFIGQTLPWASGDSTPPDPSDCESDENSAFLNMMSLKHIVATGVNTVVPRYNWTSGTVYTEYVDNVDLFDATLALPPFYVMTDQLTVYKCLNNNNGAASTIQPTGTSLPVFTLSDGYQWKYLFTIPSADVLTFVTPQWFPVSTLTANDGSTQWLVQSSAIPGTVDRIDLSAGGSQYTTVPTVIIAGNGSGATATATIGGGSVTSVVVTDTGMGYTWATVVFAGGGVAASGAIATPTISPFEGHGADPVRELGGSYVLVNNNLVASENGTFTVSNDYRQVGILSNPLLNDNLTPATALDYDQSLRLTFSVISGTVFSADEVVTGSVSAATGVVLDFDSVALVLRLVQTTGTFLCGDSVVGLAATGVLQTTTGTLVSGSTTSVVLPSGSSGANNFYKGQSIRITSGAGVGQTSLIGNYVGASRLASVQFTVAPNNTSVFIIASIVSPDLAPFSGDILYLENRRPIQRATDQTETVKVVVEF